ncbi:MAG: hypothetical protein V7L29_15480 [Nostoc sp.]|uniref:hypothetical protein n=1 Tax=Nostoc sp. TaxID=1180 RepID=UPI002FF8D1D4
MDVECQEMSDAKFNTTDERCLLNHLIDKDESLPRYGKLVLKYFNICRYFNYTDFNRDGLDAITCEVA